VCVQGTRYRWGTYGQHLANTIERSVIDVYAGYRYITTVLQGAELLGTASILSLSLSLSLQSSAVEQVLDILSWEIAEVVSPCLPRSL